MSVTSVIAFNCIANELETVLGNGNGRNVSGARTMTRRHLVNDMSETM